MVLAAAPAAGGGGGGAAGGGPEFICGGAEGCPPKSLVSIFGFPLAPEVG